MSRSAYGICQGLRGAVAFAPAFDLSDPTLRWHGARQLAANTSEVEVDWRAKWIRFACEQSWRIGSHSSVVCHGRSIGTFLSLINSMWVGKWVAVFGSAACKLLRDLVGASGFEPPTSWSRTRLSRLTL